MPELSTADADVMQSYLAQNGQQKNTLVVRFFREAARDERASDGWKESKYDQSNGHEFLIEHKGSRALKGKDTFTEVDYVEIRAPGNKDEIRVRPARESDRFRFPEAWAAYQQGLTEPASGTPLSHVPGLTKPQIMEFNAAGIRTAEHLRDVNDSDLQNFMDGNRARNRARDFLALQEGAAPAEKLRVELEARDKTMAGQAAMIEQLQKAIEELRRSKK